MAIAVQKRCPLVVAVDVDEVLAPYTPQCVAWWNEHFGVDRGETLEFPNVDGFENYEFFPGMCKDRPAAIDMIYQYHTSPYFLDMQPLPGSVEALLQLQSTGCFEFHVVTSRQNDIAAVTWQWLSRHFPGVFESMLMGNSWGKSGSKRTKAEMCQEVGASVLIDDNPDYVCAVPFPFWMVAVRQATACLQAFCLTIRTTTLGPR